MWTNSVKPLDCISIRGEREQIPLDEDAAIDAALGRWCNRLSLLGHLPHVGEKTLAVPMDRNPLFSRKGHGALPRTLRALSG